MTIPSDQPFTDLEIRFILAEVIKHSNISQQRLVDLIKDSSIEPAWNDIWIPTGRSLNNCKAVYNEIRNPQQKGTKRPFSAYSSDLRPTVGAREIVPRPPGLIAAGEPSGASTVLSPTGNAPGAFSTPPRKRGRPTKEESARREAEAREKGEEWPKPRRKQPKLSLNTQADGGSSKPAGSKLTSAKSADSSKPSTAGAPNPMAVAAASASFAGTTNLDNVARLSSHIRRPSTQQSLTSLPQSTRGIGTSIPGPSTIGIGSPTAQFNAPMNPGMYAASALTSSPSRLGRNPLLDNTFRTQSSSQSDGKPSQRDSQLRPFSSFSPGNRLTIPSPLAQDPLGQEFNPRLLSPSRQSTQGQSQLSFMHDSDLEGMQSGLGSTLTFPAYNLDSSHEHGHGQMQYKGPSQR